MIDPTKKRLAAVFTSVVVVFNVLILVLSFFVLRQSLLNGVKRHMEDDIQGEFLEQYRRSGLTPFKEVWDENHFQILNREGAIIVSTRNSAHFYPELNRGLLADALAGKQQFETRVVNNEPHLISYFLLDGNYVGRAAVSLSGEVRHARNFLKMILFTSPVMLLLSYLVSRYLLNHAMKPISDIITFQETFSSNVTHELRSPLASIKGNFEVALRKERSAEEYREVIRSGLGETDRIINLLNNLSFLASSKFKPLSLYKNKADINRILTELVASYMPAMNAKWITCETFETPGITCICDEALIRRTMENLLDNAVKYTPDGGKITLDLSRDKGKMTFMITNTSEPIDKAELKNLLTPFYRGKKSHHQADGKGLGLYIVNYIVRSHGGKVTVGMPEDRSFSVTISLPL
jgi:signal transduction histidine kinase